MIRVLVVDDQPVVRAGVRRILSPQDGFTIVGECSDGDEVPEAVRSLSPDVLLMDIRMPRLDGVSATRALCAGDIEHPPVLILTTFDDDEALWGALEAGAAGYVLKDTSAEQLITATAAVAGGGAWLDSRVTPRVLLTLRHGAPRRTGPDARVERLTEREHDVLGLMARGATNSEIAHELIVSEATVKSHVGALFAKLGARDRAAAIVFAYDHGIVGPSAACD